MTTEPGRALPLTDEELAGTRAWIASVGLCEVDGEGYCETHHEIAVGEDGGCEDSPLEMARLLATLDAARKDAAAGWAAALEESAARLAARAATLAEVRRQMEEGLPRLVTRPEVLAILAAMEAER